MVYNFVITPVTLLSFSAAKREQEVEVKWTTEEEVHMDHYEIERSSDGSNFSTVGTVNSLQQLTKLDYTYHDKKPLNGTSYYRLKMIGVSGYVKYSVIVPIQFDTQNRIAIYPNPLRSGQTLNLANPRR